MTEQDEAARAEILVRLAASREELRRLFDPSRGESSVRGSGEALGGFPRSRTMQMLMNGRGLGTLGAVASGLLIARPGLAFKLLRMLPLSAVAKALLVRGMAMMRAKHE
jgi:hypothetical protein